MGVELLVEPRAVYTWKDFRKKFPAYSIGLDGFITEGPSSIVDSNGPFANFDHHGNEDGFEMRSTSDQINMYIQMGLFDLFRKDGNPTALVCVNDPDEDTSLAWWQLKNHQLVVDPKHSFRIDALVRMEDRLDCTAGMYPFVENPMYLAMLEKMAWIFEPYHEVRMQGKKDSLKEPEMRKVIESVGERITRFVFGKAKQIPLNDQYEIMWKGDGWVFTKKCGPASRVAIFKDGYSAFVSLVSEKPDGSFVYSLVRRNPYTSFDIVEMKNHLNGLEMELGTPITDLNNWNGRNNVIGSPRITGSRIQPEMLGEFIKLIRGEIKSTTFPVLEDAMGLGKQPE